MQCLKALKAAKRFLSYQTHKTGRCVILEISAICNAQCAYCQTGFNNRNGSACKENPFISVELFTRIVQYLKNQRFLTAGTLLNLYSWGEPLLHPEFATLVRIATQEQCLLGFSTNANYLPKLPKNFDASHIAVIYISMPGFSQASYDKIHRFDFEHIKANIRRLVQDFRSHGFFGIFDIRFHVYRFNQDEIARAQAFAQSIGIAFHPYYAYINDGTRVARYFQGTLEEDYRQQAADDLFMDYYDPYFKPSITCPMLNRTYLNVHGNCTLCCMNETTVGSIFDHTLDSLTKARDQHPACQACRQSGLASVMNTCINYDFTLNDTSAKGLRYFYQCLKTCFLPHK